MRRDVSGSGLLCFPSPGDVEIPCLASVIGDILFFVCDEEGRDVGFLDGPGPGGVFRALADAAKDAWRADECNPDLEALPVGCVPACRGWREE